jgi:tetrapyrrole methylase family protein / MazG family protein
LSPASLARVAVAAFLPAAAGRLKNGVGHRKVFASRSRESPRKMPKSNAKKVRPTKHRPTKKSKVEARKRSAGVWFERLVALQARLRARNGCPWDIEQTHSTLRTYLIEEAYEVLEALESGDDTKFAEELGDLLLQVVFHAQIAAEQGRFDAADVVREIHQKMVRRHPHVFGEKRAKNASEVLKNWEQIKAEERLRKGARKSGSAASKAENPPASLLDGIPTTLPAVMQGFQLTRRASRIGFDWDHVDGVIEKLHEELGELQRAQTARLPRQVEEELGDVLFAVVNLSRFLKIDPEIALQRTNRKFSSRFREMERLAQVAGRALAEVRREEMESLWDQAKMSEKTATVK